MLKFYGSISSRLESLRSDKNGVVSFEYVIVAACVVAAVGAAFGTTSGGAVAAALTNAITAIAGLVTAAASSA